MSKTPLEPSGAFLPPHVYFLISAVFHYLGPAFAVLLFARVDVLGVAWLRIASAATVFAIWRQPWRYFLQASTAQRWLLLGLGLVLALMNCCFYLAIDRLPLATVGAIEYLASIILAAIGVRTWRNLIALGLAIGGVGLLTNLRLEVEPIGLALACANGGLFMFYIILGHRIARDGGQAGIDRLGASMLIALIVVMPFGFKDALPTLTHPLLLMAGIGVGICSSVIPYICDQLAMARLPRATFALLLSLLPASAALIGFLVLGQIPSTTELFGIVLVIIGVAIHQQKS